MSPLELQVASKDELSVRRFVVHEGISSLFDVSVIARSKNNDIDLAANVGKPAAFRLVSGAAHLTMPARLWTGVCCQMEQLRPEARNATYHVRIAPVMWLLTQRRDQRIFQHLSLPEIVVKVLEPYGIVPKQTLTLEHPKHEYVVQHGETDFAFVSRLLEEAGVSYWFGFAPDDATSLVLSDQPQLAEPRGGLPIPYVDNPNHAAGREFVTHVKIAHAVRPGKLTIRDFDFRRKPDFQLLGKAPATPGPKSPEDFYEQYLYAPGAFLVDGAPASRGQTETPVADDRSVARHDGKEGTALADRSLGSVRRGKRQVSFEANVVDLHPGVVFRMSGHARTDLAEDKKLLVTAMTLEGTPGEEWTAMGEIAFAAEPFRPLLTTPKPRVAGVESAVVVGPKGDDEIYTDEFGRVRVQFHWDREGKRDESSSCWVRVSQAWAGSGFGSMVIPRIGQEVLVAFFDGDPDQPVVVGRAYNASKTVPYALPDHKTRSTWKSDSTPKSDGYSEIRFEDRKGDELVYVQAQRDLQKLVKHDETERTGKSHMIVVGDNRGAVVGASDTTLVGEKYSVQMVKPPKEEDLKILAQQDPALEPQPTKLEMVDEKIAVTSGAAHLFIDQKDVIFEAKGAIGVKAGGNVIVKGGPNVRINS